MRVETANMLIQLHWPLITLMPDTKIATSKNWTEPKKIPATAFKRLNAGVLTGCDFWVLDIDVKEKVNGWQGLEQLESLYGKLPRTLCVNTPSGGQHRYFKHPTDRKIPCFKIPLADTWSGVESKGVGGYVVCPPSAIDGKSYDFVDVDVDGPEDLEIAETPQWLVDLILNKPERAVNLDKTEPTDLDRAYAFQLLGIIPPDCGYEEWIAVGMALHATGADWAFDLFDSWSALGHKYAGTKEIQYKWNSFKQTGNRSGKLSVGSLVHIARKYQQAPSEHYAFEWTDPTAVVFSHPEEIAAANPSDLFQSVLDQSSGVIQNLAIFFSMTSVCTDVPYYLGSAISYVHAMVQQKFSCCSDILSQYSVLDGPSTAGKSAHFDQLARLFRIRSEHMPFPRALSGKGFLKHLGRYTNRIWVQDEWGGSEVLDAMTGKNPVTHEIYRSFLLPLWSGSSEIMGTAQAKDEDEAKAVQGPRFSCLFATQSDTMESLSNCQFYQNSGFARRLDVFKSGKLNDIKVPDRAFVAKLEEAIDAYLRDWYDWMDRLETGFSIRGQPTFEVSLSPEVEAVRSEFLLQMSETARRSMDNDAIVQIYRTATQKCTRWAAVHALGRQSTIVEMADWNYAQGLFDAVSLSYKEMASGKNSQEQKTKESVLNQLAKHPHNMSQLIAASKPFRNTPVKERKDILHILEEDGNIEILRDGKKVIYQLTGLVRTSKKI